MNILNNRLIKHDLFIFGLLVIIIGSLVIIGLHGSASENASNFCKPYQSQSGSDSFKLFVSNRGEYRVWLDVESPMQISFYTIPNQYNPLLVGINGSTCLEIGQNSSIPLNTWVWLSSSSINLNRGTHIFTVSGTNISFKQIKLIEGSCIPINDGDNCN